MIDITAIITGHREGVIAGATARSACAAIEYVQERGLRCEVIVVLDRPDSDTEDVLRNGLAGLRDSPIRFVDVDEGDPGQSRNQGVALAEGQCCTFLDGDDLWSFNWLAAAWDLVEQRPDAVAHSMCNVIFGQKKTLWWHVDSEGPFFDPTFLRWSNYWDAMSFARTAIYRENPFKPNDLDLGFGHEDWHWSCLTHAKGIPHKPVLDTIHFKRSRPGSQMSLVNRAEAVVWPLEIDRRCSAKAPA
ncbi:MAG: glycosyltransferase family 2 protein [Alphaproteobacteria bacterium]|nr:glycosyltransferase family 2 protein [Alphaproteobacteria bacterium]